MGKLMAVVLLGCVAFSGCAAKMDNDWGLLGSPEVKKPVGYIVFDAKIDNGESDKKAKLSVALKPEDDGAKKRISLEGEELVAWAVPPGYYRIALVRLSDAWTSVQLYKRSEVFRVGPNQVLYVGQLNVNVKHPGAKGVTRDPVFWLSLGAPGTGIMYRIDHSLRFEDNSEAMKKTVFEQLGPDAENFEFKVKLLEQFVRCRTKFC